MGEEEGRVKSTSSVCIPVFSNNCSLQLPEAEGNYPQHRSSYINGDAAQFRVPIFHPFSKILLGDGGMKIMMTQLFFHLCRSHTCGECVTSEQGKIGNFCHVQINLPNLQADCSTLGSLV